MTKPIEGIEGFCMYLFYDRHPDDKEPYWCTIHPSGDHTEPCTIEDYWRCGARKMYEEGRGYAQEKEEKGR